MADDLQDRMAEILSLLSDGMWLELDRSSFYMAFGYRLDGSPSDRDAAVAQGEAFAITHDATFSFDESRMTARFGRKPVKA